MVIRLVLYFLGLNILLFSVEINSAEGAIFSGDNSALGAIFSGNYSAKDAAFSGNYSAKDATFGGYPISP